MAYFHEFTALWRKEKSKEELELERVLSSDAEDIYLPGYDKGRIAIKMDAVISFNEADSPDSQGYDHISVEQQGGERYRIDMKYDEFKAVMVAEGLFSE